MGTAYGSRTKPLFGIHYINRQTKRTHIKWWVSESRRNTQFDEDTRFNIYDVSKVTDVNSNPVFANILY